MSTRLTIDVILTDLDGTLLDTAPQLCGAANLMLADLGMPQTTVPTARTWIGNGVSRFIKRALTGTLDGEPQPLLLEQASLAFERHYAQLCTASQPFPGVVEGLQALQAAGHRLACITNKAGRFTLPLLRASGLADFFDLVIAGDTLPQKKPDPAPVRYACEQLATTPDRLLLIGDSRNDVEAARAAGCAVFCVPYGYNRNQPVSQLDPDAVIATLGGALMHLAPRSVQ